jgi:hypothetical protein
VKRLVWYEEHFDIRDAIQREKSLKRWPRRWKIELIEKTNLECMNCSTGSGGEGLSTFVIHGRSRSEATAEARGSMPERCGRQTAVQDVTPVLHYHRAATSLGHGS